MNVKKQKFFLNFLGKRIILLFLILGIFLYGCVSDPERLAPPKDFKTGVANYLIVPLDTDKLATHGYPLELGWNIFIWPDEHGYNNVEVKKALESIEGSYFYIYDYNEERFYFPPDGRYAQLRDHRYYSDRLFTSLRSGYRYNVYMGKEGVLRYSQE